MQTINNVGLFNQLKECFQNFLGYFLSGLVGGYVALWLERSRGPKLRLCAGESANDDNTYTVTHPKAGERWKFFRVSVENQHLKFPLNIES